MNNSYQIASCWIIEMIHSNRMQIFKLPRDGGRAHELFNCALIFWYFLIIIPSVNNNKIIGMNIQEYNSIDLWKRYYLMRDLAIVCGSQWVAVEVS